MSNLKRELAELAGCVADMRLAQRNYLETRSKDWFSIAIAREREVDMMLQDMGFLI